MTTNENPPAATDGLSHNDSGASDNTAPQNPRNPETRLETLYGHLKQAGLYEDSKPRKVELTDPPRVNGHVEPDVRSRYLARAVELEAERLAAIPMGGRNDELNVAAVSLGGLNWLGLDEAEARQALEHACTVNGHDGNFEATFRSGWDFGVANPRPAPDWKKDDLTVLDMDQVKQDEQPSIDDAFYTREEYRDPKPPKPTQYGSFGGKLPLFYAEGVHWLQGESESGKSWVALQVAVEHLQDGNRVAYLDYEDTKDNILCRLRDLGATEDEVTQFAYLNEEHSLTMIIEAAPRFSLLIVDGVTTALGHVKSTVTEPAERLTKWVNALPRKFKSSIMVDHVTKAKDSRNGMAYGSQAKKAVVTGSSYEVTCDVKPSRGGEGLITLNNKKDKPGYLPGEFRNRPLHITFNSDPKTGAVTMTERDPMALGPDEVLTKQDAFRILIGRGAGQEVSQVRLQREMRALNAGYGNDKRKSVWQEFMALLDSLS